MSNSIEQSKLCEGCSTFDGLQCINAADEIEGTCPCISCLIKMVCVDACDLYRKFDDSEWEGYEWFE